MLIYNKLRFLYHLWKLFVHYPAKSFFQRFKVLFDYLHLRRVKGLTPEEYELFRLFERSETFRHDFLGENEQRYYLDLLNPTNYYIVARNKYLAHKILDAAGVPMATLYGYYDPMAGRSGDNIARTSEEMLRYLTMMDVHSVMFLRVNGGLAQCDPWYEAFDIQPGDAYYVAPENRVKVW